MKSLRATARFNYVPAGKRTAVRSSIGRAEFALAISGLTIAVAADRLSVPIAGVNFRVELVAGGLLAAWLLLRRGASALASWGLVEIALLGWWAANVVSSLFFSPFPAEAVKYTFIIAGVLAVYAATTMLLSSDWALKWAGVAWVAVGTGVAVLSLLSALLYALFGITSGVSLERTLRNGIFTVTPQVRSVIWEPNVLGSYSLTVIALAFTLGLAPEFRDRKWQGFFRFATAAACCATALSVTRTAWALWALLVPALFLLTLKLGLAGFDRMKHLVVPIVLGGALGLIIGMQFMPTLSWRSKSPWDLSYAQVEQVAGNIIRGGSPPSDDEIKIIHDSPAPRDSVQLPPSRALTPVPVSKGSALVQKAREVGSPPEVQSVSLRAGVFNTAVQDWLRRPLLGWGTGTFASLHPPPLGGAFWIANLELHALFDAGLLGLLPLLSAFAIAGWRAVRALKIPLLAWSTRHYLLLGLLVGGAALLGAYQVTEATWLGFTWVFFAMLVAGGRLAAQPLQAA